MRLIFLTLILLISVNSFAADEANDFSIAAVVNNDIITKKDLAKRVKIITSSANIPLAQRQTISDTVLQSMIEEKLKVQEAQRLNIAVTEADVQRVVSEVERKNKISAGSFDDFLRHNNFPKDSVIEQIKAQIAWNKIVSQKIRPSISLSETQLDQGFSIAKVKPKKPKAPPEPEYKIDEAKSFVNIAQVILPKEKNSDKELLLKLADIASNTQSCADVDNLRKKNQKISFNRMGTIKVSDIDPNIRKLVANLPVGKPSQPLKGQMGVTFFILCDRNDKKIPLPAKEVLEEKEEELTKDKVADMLGSQKMDLEARRYLKRLKEEAFIEIR